VNIPLSFAYSTTVLKIMLSSRGVPVSLSIGVSAPGAAIYPMWLKSSF
jgi:hypothetical protein